MAYQDAQHVDLLLAWLIIKQVAQQKWLYEMCPHHCDDARSVQYPGYLTHNCVSCLGSKTTRSTVVVFLGVGARTRGEKFAMAKFGTTKVRQMMPWLTSWVSQCRFYNPF